MPRLLPEEEAKETGAEGKVGAGGVVVGEMDEEVAEAVDGAAETPTPA